MENPQQQHRPRQVEAQLLRRPGERSPGKASKNAQLWEDTYKELKTFHRVHGHCAPKQAENALAHWVFWQKRKRREGKLSADRIARLDKLGFNWEVQKSRRGMKLKDPTHGPKWERHFAELNDFQRASGHCSVPRYGDHGEFVPLANWLAKQRQRHTAGILDPSRLARLVELGVKFVIKQDRLDRLWSDKFQRLEAYKEKFGDCLVPQRFAEDKQLGHWVGLQRRDFKNGILRQERYERLDTIDFEWRVKPAWSKKRDDKFNEQNFEAMYERLRQFYAENGHSLVPTTRGRLDCQDTEIGRLGHWVTAQRRKFARGLIEAKRKEQLDELDFVWRVDYADAERSPEVQQKRWDEILARLLAFKKTEGHMRVPQSYAPDVKLGSWVNVQRVQRRNGSLDSRRKEKLDSVGFEWNGLQMRDERWSRIFQKLVDHHERTGSFVAMHSRDAALESWIQCQRSLHKRNEILPDRKARLDAIGFPWTASSQVARRKARPKKVESDDDSESLCESSEDCAEGMRYTVGTKVRMYFDGNGWLNGVVFSCNGGFYQVRYEVGDEEEYDAAELKEILVSKRESSRTRSALGKRRIKRKAPQTSETVSNQRRRQLFSVEDADSSTMPGESAKILDIEYATGTRVRKYFDRHGWFEGKVIDYSSPYYKVRYEDGDVEKYDIDELKAIRAA